jgi:hypothetical protein
MQRRRYDEAENVGIVLQDMCASQIRLYGDRPRDELTVSGTIEDDVREHAGKPSLLFKRSKLADEGGYYDGAGQRIQKVDFKTICSNGTGGFIVVVHPRTKKWIKSFNDIDYLPIISDDLPNYVAKPTHNRTTMTITR